MPARSSDPSGARAITSNRLSEARDCHAFRPSLRSKDVLRRVCLRNLLIMASTSIPDAPPITAAGTSSGNGPGRSAVAEAPAAGSLTDQPSEPSVKSAATAPAPTTSHSAAQAEMYDSDDPYYMNNSGSKRPRLRLAHACDRCRRRKIRCDTQQPCGPCSHTGNLCTFEAPTRRLAGASDGATGTGHPHGPVGAANSGPGSGSSARKHSSTTLGAARSGSSGPSSSAAAASAAARSADLEARLNNLEALLRRVPPSVHNALISTLDSHLSSTGAGPGGVSPSGSSASKGKGGSDALAALLASAASASGSANGSSLLTEPSESTAGGADDVARAMEGLSLSNGYLYLDEIGQTKWQGATSGFPLLDLLTAARATELSAASANQGDDSLSTGSFPGQTKGLHIANPFGSRDEAVKVNSSLTDSSLLGTSPTASTAGSISIEPTFSSILDASTSPDGFDSALPTHHVHRGRQARTQSERYFPGRAPRPSQMLNPEATWRLITNVIPGDLMDTLVRCYVSD